jgi:hypothetical protein
MAANEGYRLDAMFGAIASLIVHGSDDGREGQCPQWVENRR